MFFAAIAAFLQSLLQTWASFATRKIGTKEFGHPVPETFRNCPGVQHIPVPRTSYSS
jgi:hypothetical protein